MSRASPSLLDRSRGTAGRSPVDIGLTALSSFLDGNGRRFQTTAAIQSRQEFPALRYSLAPLPAFALILAGSAAVAQTAQFDPARLSQHVQTLGSDAFEGRAPGDRRRDQDRRLSVATSSPRPGLQPGGDLVNGQRGWTQAVPLLQSEFTAAPHVAINIAGKADAADPGRADRRSRADQRRQGDDDRRRAAGVRRLRRQGARARLGRFQGPGRARARSSSCWSTTPISRAAKAISAARR